MTTHTLRPTNHLADACASDYFFLREQLTDEQLEALSSVRAFLDEIVGRDTAGVGAFA